MEQRYGSMHRSLRRSRHWYCYRMHLDQCHPHAWYVVRWSYVVRLRALPQDVLHASGYLRTHSGITLSRITHQVRHHRFHLPSHDPWLRYDMHSCVSVPSDAVLRSSFCDMFPGTEYKFRFRLLLIFDNFPRWSPQYLRSHGGWLRFYVWYCKSFW